MFDFLIDSVLLGLSPRAVVEDYLEDLLEKAPKDPYARALYRIKSLVDRGVDPEKHTLLRVKKTNNADKLNGILKAAKKLKMTSVVKAAKAKLRILK